MPCHEIHIRSFQVASGRDRRILTQIEIGITIFKEKMVEYARRYGLDGVADTICLVIADIRHQGRASSAEIQTALRSSKPLDNLLDIGKSRFPHRIDVLRQEIGVLTKAGTLGVRKYSAAKNDFV